MQLWFWGFSDVTLRAWGLLWFLVLQVCERAHGWKDGIPALRSEALQSDGGSATNIRKP